MGQLTQVHLGNDDLVERPEHRPQVGRQRRQVPQVGLRDRQSPLTQGPARGADRAVGRTPAQDENGRATILCMLSVGI